MRFRGRHPGQRSGRHGVAVRGDRDGVGATGNQAGAPPGVGDGAGVYPGGLHGRLRVRRSPGAFRRHGNPVRLFSGMGHHVLPRRRVTCTGEARSPSSDERRPIWSTGPPSARKSPTIFARTPRAARTRRPNGTRCPTQRDCRRREAGPRIRRGDGSGHDAERIALRAGVHAPPSDGRDLCRETEAYKSGVGTKSRPAVATRRTGLRPGGQAAIRYRSAASTNSAATSPEARVPPAPGKDRTPRPSQKTAAAGCTEETNGMCRRQPQKTGPRNITISPLRIQAATVTVQALPTGQPRTMKVSSPI